MKVLLLIEFFYSLKSDRLYLVILQLLEIKTNIFMIILLFVLRD